MFAKIAILGLNRQREKERQTMRKKEIILCVMNKSFLGASIVEIL